MTVKTQSEQNWSLSGVGAQLLLQMRDQRAHIGVVAATRTPHRIEPHLLALEERGLTRNVYRRDREKTRGERSEDAARDILSADRHFSLPFRTRMRPIAGIPSLHRCIVNDGAVLDRDLA